MSYQRITLDNPVFAGRLKTHAPRTRVFERMVATERPHIVMDVFMRPHAPKPGSKITKIAYASTDQALPQKARPEPVKSEAIAKPQASRKTKKSKTTLMLFAMALTLFLFGVSVAILGLRTNQNVAAQVNKKATNSNSTVTTGETPPAEAKPSKSSYGAYYVSPDLPRFLRVPQLSVDARVRRLGVDAKNQLQAPNNIYDAGWYEGSSKPGDAAGAVLIDGHVHGSTQPGVFYDLKKLIAGDKIQIERGDGKIYNFKVVKSQAYNADKVDMAAALVSIVPGKLGLNLMTCTGQVKGTDYQQRLIVFAVQE